MVVMIVGLGSMGRRRIRLLREYDSNITIVGVDSKYDRRIQAEEEYKIVTCSSVAEALRLKNFFAAFISTSPLSHNELIAECLNREMHVFSEINLVKNGYDSNITLAKEKGKVLFLSSTIMYRKEIEYIKRRVKEIVGTVSYNYHVGQYLPDWHPWENYKDFFVGKKETNGCRELMAIEFPWIFDTFGNAKKIEVKKSRHSSLNIDYYDTYQLLIEHENGNCGMVQIDVVSRMAKRQLDVIGEEMYITWEGTPESLSEYDLIKKTMKSIDLYNHINRASGYRDFIIEDAYMDEIKNFFGIINGTDSPLYTFEKDKNTLKLIDIVEGGIA